MYLDVITLARPFTVATPLSHIYNACVVLGMGCLANPITNNVNCIYIGRSPNRYAASVTSDAVYMRRMCGLDAAVDQARRVSLPYLVDVAEVLGEHMETSRISRVLSSVPDRLAVHLVIRALEVCARRPSEIWDDT